MGCLELIDPVYSLTLGKNKPGLRRAEQPPLHR